MRFTEGERKRLAGLADVLIPAAESRLSASEADVAGSGLDQFLVTCPEMAVGLRKVLLQAVDEDAGKSVEELRINAAANFGVLAEFAAGAYFLSPKVREAIGYAGQTARPIDPAPDYLDNGLLESVIRRGPIYRPTPQ